MHKGKDKVRQIVEKKNDGKKQENKKQKDKWNIKNITLNSIKPQEGMRRINGFLSLLANIRAKLILAFLVPVALIILLGIISYMKSSQGLTSNYETSAVSNMANMTNYLDFGFDIVASKADLLNSNKIMQNYYAGTYKSDRIEEGSRYREVQDFVTSNVLSEDYISNITLMADYGSGISGNGTISSRLVYDDFIAQGDGALLAENSQKGMWVGTHPYLDIQSNWNINNYAISYMRYLYSASKKPIGCIVLDVSYQYVYKVLEGSGLPEGSVAAFVTKDGREIVYGDLSEDYKLVDQKYYQTAQENPGSIEGLEYVEYKKDDYLFLYSKIAASDSMLCALIPKAEIVKQADSLKNITLLLVITASLIAIGLGTYIASGLSTMIQKIIHDLHNTAAGDLTTVITVKRKDEFQILGKGINDMIASMKKIISNMTGVSSTLSKSSTAVAGSSIVLVEATKNISGAVGDIEQGITQQAVDAQNCLNQMADLAYKINEVYESTHNIELIAGRTKETIHGGRSIIDELSDKAKETTSSTNDVISDIEGLVQESASIISIVSTMNEIAGQTNLLSLNASIEAARAGNAGRGFAVVAEEIRKLADQSLRASAEIATIIQRIEAQTKKTVTTANYAKSIVLSQDEALNNTVHVFSSINEQVEYLTSQLNHIVEGIEGIEHAKDDTLSAIESISATAEETAAAAEQLNVTAERQFDEVNKLNEVVQQLSENAANLEDTVRVFKIN
jgi:methyl-accepting chemotaxis protein